MPHHYPPNLVCYLTNGFSAKRFDFLGTPIFNLTNAQGNTLSFGPWDRTFDIPDDFACDGISSFTTITNNKMIEQESDFDQSFSFGISAGGKVKRLTMGAEAEASSKLSLHGKLFHSTNQVHNFDFAVQTVFQVQRVWTSSELTSNQTTGFAAALGALPVPQTNSSTTTPLTPVQWELYFQFFDTYGTHYLLSGSLGGYFICQTDIDKLLLKSESAAEIGLALSGSFNAAVATGTLSIESAFNQKSFLSDNAESLHTRYACRGGLFDTDLHRWVHSCFRNPILVPGINGLSEPVLAPISTLATGATQSTMETALRIYLGKGRVLGSSTQQKFGVELTAQESCLVFVSLYSVQENSVQGTGAAWFNSPHYTTSVQGQNIEPGAGVTQCSPSGSFLIPLAPGDTCTNWLNPLPPTSPVDAYVFQMPLVNPLADGSCWGSPSSGPTPPFPNQPKGPINALQSSSASFVPHSDGLFVGSLNFFVQPGCFSMTLTQNSLTIGGCGTFSSGASSGSGNTYATSFAAPVFANQECQVTSYSYLPNTSQASPYARGWFVPLTNGIGLGEARSLQSNVAYRAETDGFLVGLITSTTNIVTSNKPAPVLNLNTARDLELVSPTHRTKPPPISTLASASPPSNFGAPSIGSAMIPVHMGDYFCAELLNPGAVTGIECTVLWYPLVIIDAPGST